MRAIARKILVPLLFFVALWAYSLLNPENPCEKPVKYEVGSFDNKFGLQKESFINALGKAEQIWEKPFNKEFFTYSPGGTLKVNLVYDERQETADRLEKLGLKIEESKSFYEVLETKYNSLNASLNQKRRELTQLSNSYEQRLSAYESDVRFWNSRGGAPSGVYARLEEEENQLNYLANEINARQSSFNELVDNLNAIANTLNRLAAELNLGVKKYNTEGSAGKEFNAGLYKSDQNGTEINIYYFNDNQDLVIILAHELGHALGLEHLDNPSAIMYKLVQTSQKEALTSDDISALKNTCDIQ